MSVTMFCIRRRLSSARMNSSFGCAAAVTLQHASHSILRRNQQKRNGLVNLSFQRWLFKREFGSSSFRRNCSFSQLELQLPRDDWHLRKDLRPFHPITEEKLTKPVKEARIIDGKSVAQKIKQEIADEVMKLKNVIGKTPCLAIVLVGNQKDSEIFIRTKRKACDEVGISSFFVNLAEDSSQEEILKLVQAFNEDPSVHGILVQLPLPKHIDEEKVMIAISAEKDVDGFHPTNIGRLAMQGRQPLFVPCSPKGCIELLLRSGVQIQGSHVVVVGRDNIVGIPLAMLLQRHQATVTVVHSYTPNPAEVSRTADIVIATANVPYLVRGDWIKLGAIVLDAGLNAIEDPSSKKGYRRVGDVCFDEASARASAITPVPGGVGPMTIVMLLSNTLESAKRFYGLK